MGERERERDTDRQTDRQIDRQTDREAETEREREWEVCVWGGGGAELLIFVYVPRLSRPVTQVIMQCNTDYFCILS